MYLNSHFDPRTNQREPEVRIIHLQNLANQLSGTYVDIKRVKKSNISITNALARVDVLEGQNFRKTKFCQFVNRAFFKWRVGLSVKKH